MELVDMLCIFLITMFALSGAMKLLQYKSFRKTLNGLGFSGISTSFLALFVPLSECASSMLLIFPSTRRWGELLILILLIGFTYSIWKAKSLRSSIACNCFGNLMPETIGPKTSYRIVVLFVINATVFTFQNDKYVQADVMDWILTIFASLSIILLYSLLITMNDYRQVIKKSKV